MLKRTPEVVLVFHSPWGVKFLSFFVNTNNIVDLVVTTELIVRSEVLVGGRRKDSYLV